MCGLVCSNFSRTSSTSDSTRSPIPRLNRSSPPYEKSGRMNLILTSYREQCCHWPGAPGLLAGATSGRFRNCHHHGRRHRRAIELRFELRLRKFVYTVGLFDGMKVLFSGTELNARFAPERSTKPAVSGFVKPETAASGAPTQQPSEGLF